MKLHAFPYDVGQTATLWNHPVLTIEVAELPTQLPRAVLEAILKKASDPTHWEYIKHKVPHWSNEKIVFELAEGYSFWFSHVAFIPDVEVIITMLHEVGDQLADNFFGGDSSTYAACKTFSCILDANAVAKVEMPPLHEKDPQPQ